MKIAVGADEFAPIVEDIINYLQQKGHTVQLFGSHEPGQCMAWSPIAIEVAKCVSIHQYDEAILLCWTGTGMSIAANKIKGIRAALCEDQKTAQGARVWNNANILCLSIRKLSTAIAEEILESWFNTKYKPNPQDDACLAAIDTLEKNIN